MSAKIPGSISVPSNAPTDILQVSQLFSWLTAALNNWIAIVAAYLTPGQLFGTSTNDNASAGNVGELINSTILSGSAVPVSSGVPANITSISLTAGDWDVFGLVSAIPAGTTVITSVYGGQNTVSATLPDNALVSGVAATNAAGSPVMVALGPRRMLLASTTTVYLVCNIGFNTSTCAACGYIRARRAR